MVVHSLSAPETISLPASDPLVHGLLIVGFFVHAVFMNLVVGGTLVTVMTDAMGIATGRAHYRQLATTMSHWLPGFGSHAVDPGPSSLWPFIRSHGESSRGSLDYGFYSGNGGVCRVVWVWSLA